MDCEPPPAARPASRPRPSMTSPSPAGDNAQRPIITLTMNPALDVATSTERIAAERKLRCTPPRIDPGGGGVNVVRAIHNLGGDAVAVLPLGGPTGEEYREHLRGSGISWRGVSIAGSTRESITVDETSTGEQFRFVLPGPHLEDSEVRECLAALRDELPVDGYLVVSGSVPPGVPDDFYRRIVELARERRARVVVDAAGDALAAALREGVHLIKPSRDELAELTGADRPLTDAEELRVARTLVEEGRAERVALTRGSSSALLVTAEGAWELPVPQVPVVSAVGAGDAFLAGIVLGFARGLQASSALRTAVAAGTATTILAGTGMCRTEDVACLEADLPVPSLLNAAVGSSAGNTDN